MKNNKKITRSEIVMRVRALICQAYHAGIDEKYYEELSNDIGRLSTPVTLAEFLGWEEGKEYELATKKYSIKRGALYHFDRCEQRWLPTEAWLDKSFIMSLQRAELVTNRYYLVNPEIDNPRRKYLNAKVADNTFVDISFLDKSPEPYFLTEFSKNALKAIERKYPRTFSICEKVLVNNDDKDEE